MTELNDREPMKIKVLGPYTFSIGDTRNMSEYTRGGVVVQVKMPKVLSFKPLEEAMKEPNYVITDFAKFEHPAQLHIAFETLHRYIELNGNSPKPWCREDAENFLKMAKESKLADGVEVDEKLLSIFAKVNIFILYCFCQIH